MLLSQNLFSWVGSSFTSLGLQIPLFPGGGGGSGVCRRVQAGWTSNSLSFN